ncbi:hypothetical protein [Winogradskyella pulchriflava]|uniref:Uncharacterized protein n=1 Tax=Winogradskyella pulchriflava TaxID=1110688 RepID=A0ABV6Q9M6_9FLAO
MDCLKTYNHFYKKAQDVSKRMIIAKMRQAKLKNRPFSTIHNNITRDLHHYINDNYTNNLETNFNEAYSMFQKKHTYYDGTESDRIKWILEDEVKKAFEKNHVSSYAAFISDLAVEASLNMALNHYYNYRDYYQLVYDLNKYEFFFFKDFVGISFKDSEYFKNMIDDKYPQKAKEREQKMKMLAPQSPIKKETKDITDKSKSEKELSIMELLDSFSDDEKFLIIHIINILISKSSPLQLTDLMKLVRIVGTYDDLAIFLKSAKGVTAYTKVSKGVDYYRGDNQLKIINSTIQKLSSFNIEIVNHQLLQMRHIHLNNKVNIRKS